MRKILAEGVILAKDQNRDFVEKASSRKLSPIDAVLKYLMRPGKGNAYVEFDIEEDLPEFSHNHLTKNQAWSIAGDVDLTRRNAEAFFNF